MMNLELFYYRHNRYGLAQRMAACPIRYHELTLVIDGTLEYRVGGRTVSLCSGDAVLVRADENRERTASAGKVDYVSFNFTCDALPEGLPTYLAGAASREIGLLLAACDEISDYTKVENNRRRAFVLTAVLQLLCERSTVTYSPLVTKILQYLHAHLAERITLTALGERLHFSPVYCDTVFKRETGRSIIAYLIGERMELAKQLLEEGRPLRDTAAAVGFEDYNYFARCFKKHVGYTPLQYRKFLFGK